MISLVGLLKYVQSRKENYNNKLAKVGFTIVELAIVLVTIGLLFGGILMGRDLIKAAEVRAIIKEEEEYKSATNTFRTKYNNQIPGDMRDATSYFGAKADCSDRTELVKTCNGNGDGIITNSASTVTVGNENFLFWQHLADAGLISGSFSGVEGTQAIIDIDAGINTPNSKIRGASFFVRNETHASDGSDNGYFKIDYGNFFVMGLPDAGQWIRNPVVTPAEAYSIDLKIDDGKPATGKFVARYYSLCTNAASYTDLTADYNLTRNQISCVIQFIKLF